MSFCFLGFFIYFNKRPLSEIYGGRLLERGVYRIFLGLYWAFIGEGRLKESGRLLGKILVITHTLVYSIS